MEVIHIHNYWTGKIENEIHASYESQCGHFLRLILTDYQIESTEPKLKGIYVATSDAGKAPSIDFWRAALEYGLSYASPKNFPWTLANFPCSYFARALNIQGPNFTLVGNGNAFIGAYKHAAEHLLIGEITEAIVIGIDFRIAMENATQFAAIVLKKSISNTSIITAQEIAYVQEPDLLKPSEILDLICTSIPARKELTFGNQEEGFFKIEYST